MLVRITVIAVLAVAMAALGLPFATADSPDAPPPTVSAELDGVPVQPEAPSVRSFAAAEEALVSRAVATPIPFSVVGVTLPEGAEVALRTSADGRTWTDWQGTDQVDEAPDPGTAEAAAASPLRHAVPIWVGEATHLQLRVTGGSPDDVDVHLIDSMGLGRSVAGRALDVLAAAWRGTPPSAAASVNAPRVVTRAEWGADESRRSGSPSYAANARVAVVHHTAGTNDYTSAQAAGLVRGIYAYHTGSLGWADVGYNVLIDRYGTVYEGRAGGLERAVVGAHAGGWNTGTFGVALMGQHQAGATGVPTYAPATAAAVDALVDVLAWKMDVHHIDARATARLTAAGAATSRYAAGTTVEVPTIVGHIRLSNTSCPGSDLVGKFEAIKSRVVARQSPMFVQPEIGPVAQGFVAGATVRPVTFSAGLVPAGAWSLRITDGSGAVVHSASGSGSSLSASWQPPARPGTYRYALTATGRRPVQGDLSVLHDVVERVGTASAPAAASVQISRAAFPSGGSAQHAVLARADVFADAMAGGPLAGREGPLLLTPSAGLDSGVRAELERVLPAGRTVYVLGGTEALTPAVTTELEGRWRVERVFGGERTATAAKVAAHVRARSGATTAMVARAGPDDAAPWADALAGGAYGAREGIPVLLTYPDRLMPATRDAAQTFDRTIVLGGTAAVSDAVMAGLPAPTRISGGDRVGTSVEIAEQLWGKTSGGADDLVLVGGGFQHSSWTLSLAAAPLAARRGSPLLLSSGTDLSAATRQHVTRLGYGGGRAAEGRVLGGASVVSDRVVAELSALLQ